ncbi:MAG: hypothetical protein JOY71_05495 [Acetobacteraceae bacterium]|nr:hypothetical protein [Acetobacteraceae bacterium]MBV8588749.1 hypothetical protein [Acetobacteraceae bacterium]
MSLLVAGINDGHVWMVADTAIIGPDTPIRSPDHSPKIEICQDRAALAGFAGNDAFNAGRLIRALTTEPAGDAGLNLLLKGSREQPVNEFAYAFFDGSRPRLLRVHCGEAKEETALYLGVQPAFEAFQRIRHKFVEPFAPKSLKLLVGGAKSGAQVPEALFNAVRAMLDLFATWSDRDVGGCALGYFLSEQGANFFSYGYGVSDPLFDKLAPGSLVPHGTPEEGGASLSVGQLADETGIVVYWLQRPGGTVFVRRPHGYERYDFDGPPAVFKQRVRDALGTTPEMWISDQPPGPIKAVRVMRDAEGRIHATIGDHDGGSITVAVQNVATSFDLSAEKDVTQPATSASTGVHANRGPISVSLSSDRKRARFTVVDQGKVIDAVLSVEELDHHIQAIGDLRRQIVDEVPRELPSGPHVVVPDPIWRTFEGLHPSLDGIVLHLRHIGLGWVSFLLPRHEAQSLGT